MQLIEWVVILIGLAILFTCGFWWFALYAIVAILLLEFDGEYCCLSCVVLLKDNTLTISCLMTLLRNIGRTIRELVVYTTFHKDAGIPLINLLKNLLR
jgi:hypothetical protein